MLRKIYEHYTRSVNICHPLSTAASSLLKDICEQFVESEISPFPQFDAFSAALQADLLLRFDAPLIAIPGTLHYRDALFELGNGHHRRTNLPSDGNQASLLIDLEEPMDGELPDIMSLQVTEGAVKEHNEHEESAKEQEASITDAEGEDSLPPSQLLTSSQLDTLNATMDMNIDIPLDNFEIAEPEAQLSEEERLQMEDLADRLTALDAHGQSQVDLNPQLVVVAIDCTAIYELLPRLKLEARSDGTIFAFLSAVLMQDASYARLCILLENALLSRVVGLTKVAPRSLLNVLNLVAEREARALADSVLVPLAAHPSFAVNHVELLIRIVKILQTPLQDLYFDKLLSAPKNFAFVHLDLFAKLMLIRPHLDPSMLRFFVSHLQRRAEESLESKSGEKVQAIVWTLLQKNSAPDLVEHKATLTTIVKKYSSSLGEKNLAKLQSL